MQTNVFAKLKEDREIVYKNGSEMIRNSLSDDDYELIANTRTFPYV